MDGGILCGHVCVCMKALFCFFVSFFVGSEVLNISMCCLNALLNVCMHMIRVRLASKFNILELVYSVYLK